MTDDPAVAEAEAAEAAAPAAPPEDPPPPAAEGEAAHGFAIAPRPRAEDAEALLAHLRAAPADAPLVLDASAVEQLSTPVVLALVAAARARAEAGAPLAVERPSPPFVDAFSDLGLFQDLMKMEFRT